MNSNPSNTVRQLRALMPSWKLGPYQAKGVAERQALRALAIWRINDAPVDLGPLLELPRIAVRVDARLARLGISGLSESRRGGGWTITINQADSSTRRRFTLAHEFKHVIDHPFLRTLYPNDTQRDSPAAEAICDYFAACLLMPRAWVKQLWYGGLQDIDVLAARFRVSPAAMSRRLQDMRLIDRATQHGVTRRIDVTRYFRRDSTLLATHALAG